jgi:hypothetical protein
VATGTQQSAMMIYWTVTQGENADYTSLPALMVTVGGKKGSVTVPDPVKCTYGGNSVPMMVSISNKPFTDVTVTLKMDELASGADATTEVPKSVGIALGLEKSKTFTKESTSGVLSFACGPEKTTTATMLKVELTGTDKASFTAPTSITVSPTKAGQKVENPPLTLTTETGSTVSHTYVKGVCPSLGEAWIELLPDGATATAFASAEEVAKAHAELAAADNTGKKMYRETQMCNKAVATDTDVSGGVLCGFHTGSAMKYSARLFCFSTEGFYYSSVNGTAVVAVSNGGKVIKTSLTYTKKIDVLSDNTIVNTLLCKMASQLEVVPDLVQDEFSGWCGN